MPRRIQPGFRSDPLVPPAAGETPPAPDDTQIVRWAEQIAAGRDPFPDTLTPLDRERLEAAVRDRLRDRMTRLIAKIVAARIHRDRSFDTEVPRA